MTLTEGHEIPTLSPWEDLLFNLGYVVPMAMQGTFTRSRRWVTVMSRVHPDPAAVRFVGWLRKRHQGGILALHLGPTKSLLVLDPASIQHILDRSPDRYADPPPKHKGMGVFQPNAVTVSRGADWQDRRRFNEAVLDSNQPVHQYAQQFLTVVHDEVTSASRLECWDDFDLVFARIMRQTIFGRAARDDAELTARLRRLMLAANRPIRLGKPSDFDPFYTRVRHYLRVPEAGSLVALCRQTPATARTHVENQIPHWMFAMWETLGTNTVRALSAILAHPEAEARVRAELAAADLDDPYAVARLPYLEWCLLDAMRLWPTTPMLLREALTRETLDGVTIPAGRQIIIWNSFNHRNRAAYPLADRFAPDAWAEGRPSALFNALSSGPQVCAGVNLLLFIGKAVLATMLRQGRYVLLEPPLDPRRPMPYAFNVFDLRLRRRA
jgi:cytochrome P450